MYANFPNKLPHTLILIFILLLSSNIFADDKLDEEPRHQGWHIGGAAVLHTFYYDTNDDDDRNPSAGLGGGATFWGGYRGKGRWAIRLNLNAAALTVNDEISPDFLFGFSIEPVLHFRKNPIMWDPYLILPEVGVQHLFRNSATGITFVLPGVGLQVHLSERFSIYGAFKLRWGLMSPGITVDGEFPFGVSYRF